MLRTSWADIFTREGEGVASIGKYRSCRYRTIFCAAGTCTTPTQAVYHSEYYGASGASPYPGAHHAHSLHDHGRNSTKQYGADDRSWITPITNNCASTLTSWAHTISLNRQEKLIKDAIDEVLYEICRVIGDVWVDAFGSKMLP